MALLNYAENCGYIWYLHCNQLIYSPIYYNNFFQIKDKITIIKRRQRGFITDFINI
jgi:hypothetical protein